MTEKCYQIPPKLTLAVRSTGKDEFTVSVGEGKALIVYISGVSGDDLKSKTYRSRMAVVVGATVANNIECQQKEILIRIEDILDEFVSEEYPTAEPTARDSHRTLLMLLKNTLRVISFSSEEEESWFVKMAPPDESPIEKPQFFEFSSYQFFEENHGAFKISYQEAFGKGISIDSEEMHGLVGYWIDMADYGPHDKESLGKLLAENEVHEVKPETQ